MAQPEILYEYDQVFFNEHATRWVAMSVLMEYTGVSWFDLKFRNEELRNQFEQLIDNSVNEWKRLGDEAVSNYGHLTL